VGRAAGAVPEGSTILDLYAGVGLLGGALAAGTPARLVAVESNRAAAADATVNLADLDARVVTGEVAQACRTPLVAGCHPAVVIADPARTGLGPSSAAAIAAIGAPVVVLVSCDPASFGRDAGLLTDAGYRLAGVEVLDLFPGTVHIEAVSRFVADGGPVTPR
jgi:tRNA/tmRNA/rRNA uracil-C5-methylase (TrmA/RlmC/RlmD family)